mgnify:CR=1 FL=1
MSFNNEIDAARIPRHVAIIMDGNGRWAKAKGLPRTAGHQEGVETVKKITEEAVRLGVKYLTLYTFSTENWNRPVPEIAALMGLILDHLEDEIFMKNNVRFRVIAGAFGRMYAAYGREREDDDGHRIELFFPLGIGAGNAANSRRGAGRCLVAVPDNGRDYRSPSGYPFYAGSGFADPYRRRIPYQQLPVMAMCLYGILFL